MQNQFMMKKCLHYQHLIQELVDDGYYTDLVILVIRAVL